MSDDPLSTGNPLDPRRRPGAPTPEEAARSVDRYDSPGHQEPAEGAGSLSSDPDPASTPGLEKGGGVAPGDTPPIESGTSGLATPEVKGPSRAANLAIPIGIVALIVLAGVALLVGRLAGG